MSECIPFGWKSSAYVYHTTGLVASHRLRSWNIPSSLYNDDRHNGQLTFPAGSLPSAYRALASTDEVNFSLAARGYLPHVLRLNFPWLLHRPGKVCTHPSKEGVIESFADSTKNS